MIRKARTERWEDISFHPSVVKKSDSGRKVVDDFADVVQSFDRHVPSIAEATRDGLESEPGEIKLSSPIRSSPNLAPESN
jgi:hypothetical protein